MRQTLLFYLIFFVFFALGDLNHYKKSKPYVWEIVNIPVISGTEKSVYENRFRINCEVMSDDLDENFSNLFNQYCQEAAFEFLSGR